MSIEGSISRDRLSKRERVHMSEVSPESARETVDKLLEHISKPEHYIDEGGAAKVFRTPNGRCIKVLAPRHDSPNAHLMNLGNMLQEEAAFLERLSHFSSSGVRSPRYLGYIRDTDSGFSALLMEELDAVNLQHVLNRTEKFPKSFNADVFLKALADYVQVLNERAHVSHNDLEPRNVMIDRASGLPRIIDFGRSKSLTQLQKDKKEALIAKDWACVEAIERAVDKILTPEHK